MRIAAACAGSVLLVGVTALLVVQGRADDVIYRTKSEFNTIVVTEDSDGVRTLRFADYGARQSVVKLGDPDYIELPYAKAMQVGLAAAEDPKRVLIVGLGGGTIPQFLRQHFPELLIDVVELDPAVLRVARTYFGFQMDDRMRAFVADGRRFIEQSEPVYDVIYLDAYSADSVPYALTTRQFLEATRKALKPGGVVVGNVWSSRSNELYDSMVRTYQHVFAQVAINDVRGVGNKIVVATVTADALGKERVGKRAASVTARGRFPYDLKEIVDEGYHLLSEPDGRGEVLEDR
jgi:spermidine synthase